jgi:hypothetical protein
MSDEPVARKALRAAERASNADASRLVASVPGLMREAQRRRHEAAETSASLPQLATRALPRLAAATAIAVIAATGFVVWERGKTTPAATPTTLESVIIGGDGEGTGDVVFDALLDTRRNDG